MGPYPTLRFGGACGLGVWAFDRDIQFWNFLFGVCALIPCYLLELFIHAQDVNDIDASYGRFGLSAIGLVWFLIIGSD